VPLVFALALFAFGQLTGSLPAVTTVSVWGWLSAVTSGVLYYAIGFWLYLTGRDGLGMARTETINRIHSWLNRVGDMVKAGTVLSPAIPVDRVLDGYAFEVREVDRSWYRALFGTAMTFYQAHLCAACCQASSRAVDRAGLTADRVEVRGLASECGHERALRGAPVRVSGGDDEGGRSNRTGQAALRTRRLRWRCRRTGDRRARTGRGRG